MNRPAGEYPVDPRRSWPGYPRAPQYPPQPGYSQPGYQGEPTYLPPLPPPRPPAAPHRPPLRPHRRSRRLWYIVAVAVLLPGWLCFLVWRSAGQPYAKQTYAIGTVVDPGSTAEVDGATWRFGSIAPASAPAGSLSGPPPRDATLVRAYVEITPHTTAAAKKIADCRFAAQDDQGRVWDADDDYRPDQVSGCSPPESAAEYIPAGRTQSVSAAFLVPRDATRSLRPMVKPTSEDSYVLFR